MKTSEKLLTAFAAVAMLMAAGATAAVTHPKQADIECPGAGGKPALSLHFDKVREYPAKNGTLLVKPDGTQVNVPKSCIVSLKP